MVVFGLILVAIAFACQPVKNLVWEAFELVGIPACALLGVFLFGLLTRCQANRSNIFAMLTGSIITTGLCILIQYKTSIMAWTWLILIGTAITFTSAFALGKQSTPRPRDQI